MLYYSVHKDAYRDFAVKWAKWSETAKLTPTETEGIAKFFLPVGKRFGLIKEFRQLGII